MNSILRYVGEGMELNEFLEAREDLEFLDRDYIDVVTDRNQQPN